MKNNIYKSRLGIISVFMALLFMVGCEDLVEKGYTIDYSVSDAEFTVKTIGLPYGAAGDTINFHIEAKANNDIKSCVVQATNPGAGGSGFDISIEGYDDPFADHNFGTMQKNIRSFVIRYNYIVPEEVNSSQIVFSLVEQNAKVNDTTKITVVNNTTRYVDKMLYAKDNKSFDAFATIDGLVYGDIVTNYSSKTAENIAVQEDIDILFYAIDGNSVIASPGFEDLPVILDIQNKTLFKKMDHISHQEFYDATSAELVALTKNDSIGYNGTTSISEVKVGDIIGFTTDINALHSYKTGLIKVNQLHPTSINRYEGTSYVMEFDIITQID